MRAELRRNGFRKVRQSGSHETWRHERFPVQVGIAGKDGADARDYNEEDLAAALAKVREAERQAGGEGR